MVQVTCLVLRDIPMPVGRTEREAYAPDEMDALLQLAQSTGASLDLLSLRGARNPNSIEHLTETLRATVYEAISDGFERLGDRIPS